MIKFNRGITKDFGKHLKEALWRLDITPAKLVQRTGITRTEVYFLLHQKQLPTVHVVQRILENLPISYEELIGIPWYLEESA